MPPSDPAKRPTPLAHRRSPEIGARRHQLLLVPVGSCEQHGPHLPLATDTIVAVAVAEGAAAQRTDVVVAPAVSYGASGEHAGFPGTLSLGTEALRGLLVELGRSAFPPRRHDHWRALVLVDGHGGNRDAVAAAVAQLQAEGRPVSSWSPRIPGGDAHAGRTETSLLLAIAPDLVGRERPVGEVAPLAEILPALRSGGVGAVAPNGVLGDARGASAAEGRDLLAALVADLVEILDPAGATS
ncbi:MAG TPA: mycofactocin biosynthesis peptidyl-dipeptidase MftE [Acidimicrobiales bacterium]|nr:mycofactocin biosynthesis peptidyl-dipeptidase MftE [Acidimicrobiales bacterium]